MTTLTLNNTTTITCAKHVPHVEAISTSGAWSDTQDTFCEVCEQNITRFWLEFDGDRMDMWSKWSLVK